LTFCIGIVVIQWAFTVTFPCQVWLKFLRSWEILQKDIFVTYFGLAWPWSFASWCLKSTVSCSTYDNLYQDLFTLFHNIMSTSLVVHMNLRTNEWTKGQSENTVLLLQAEYIKIRLPAFVFQVVHSSDFTSLIITVICCSAVGILLTLRNMTWAGTREVSVITWVSMPLPTQVSHQERSHGCSFSVCTEVVITKTSQLWHIEAAVLSSCWYCYIRSSG